jgi:hypothetical protein
MDIHHLALAENQTNHSPCPSGSSGGLEHFLSRDLRLVLPSGGVRPLDSYQWFKLHPILSTAS